MTLDRSGRGCIGGARRRAQVRRLFRVAAVAAFLTPVVDPFPSSGQSLPPPAGVLAAWVELTPTGPSVRVVTDAASCPRAGVSAAADESPAWGTPLVVRAMPAPPDFPNLVCEWQPSPAVGYVHIAGWPTALRLPPADPQRIVVFGDSGCLGKGDQNCASDWPFADIVRWAAGRQPDLVIHVGDLNYRGTNCVAYDGCCTYNPINCGFPACGDSWATWQADFFTPAAPLLAAAPWVVTRGNHELCSRGGRGWFRYLDPHSPPPTCPDNPVEEMTYTAPYPVSFGDRLRLLVMDSANACGEWPIGNQISRFREQFGRLAEYAATSTAAQTWLIAHRSPWGILRDTPASKVVLNYTLQHASANRLPSEISLVLAGHEHLFQSLTFAEPEIPPVLLVGTGGAILDDPAQVPERVERLPVGPGGPTIDAALTIHDHGYLLMQQSDGAWTATFYDRFDQPLATCASLARPWLCTPVVR